MILASLRQDDLGAAKSQLAFLDQDQSTAGQTYAKKVKAAVAGYETAQADKQKLVVALNSFDAKKAKQIISDLSVSDAQKAILRAQIALYEGQYDEARKLALSAEDAGEYVVLFRLSGRSTVLVGGHRVDDLLFQRLAGRRSEERAEVVQRFDALLASECPTGGFRTGSVFGGEDDVPILCGRSPAGSDNFQGADAHVLTRRWKRYLQADDGPMPRIRGNLDRAADAFYVRPYDIHTHASTRDLRNFLGGSETRTKNQIENVRSHTDAVVRDGDVNVATTPRKRVAATCQESACRSGGARREIRYRGRRRCG